MKKADYIEAFKNKASWKKARAVIFLVDYKLEGKKTVIALPYQKASKMKLEMKRLKIQKLHPLKKSGAGIISFNRNADGGIEASVELLFGGLTPELLFLKAAPLFEKLRVKIIAIHRGEALASEEEDFNANFPEHDLSDNLSTDASVNTPKEKPKTYKTNSINQDMEKGASIEFKTGQNNGISDLINNEIHGEVDNEVGKKQNSLEQIKVMSLLNKEDIYDELKEILNKTRALCDKLGLNINALNT